VTFDHSCFFTFEDANESVLKKVMENRQELVDALIEQGIPAHVGNGFGFDFLIIDSFFAVARKRHVVRFAFGELSSILEQRAAVITERWLAQHLRRD
jgi:hypothetical protein